MMYYRLFIINVKAKHGVFCTQTLTGIGTGVSLDKI